MYFRGGGGDSIYPWAGRGGPAPHALTFKTLFKTKNDKIDTLIRTKNDKTDTLFKTKILKNIPGLAARPH